MEGLSPELDASPAEPVDVPSSSPHLKDAAAFEPMEEQQQQQQQHPEGQKYLEIPHGNHLGSDGRPVQPGPQYKRGRGRSFFKDPPRKGVACQVPGCDRSLHKLRDYYKRYKICPYHLELNCMVVEGQSIRFCQQCGRFQLLDEFDGDRRSCRKKLEKHNERRRKLEGSTMTDSDSGGEGSGGRSRSGHKLQRSGSPNGFPAGVLPAGHGYAVNDILHRLTSDYDLMQGMGAPLAHGLQSMTMPSQGRSGWGAPPPPMPPMHHHQYAGPDARLHPHLMSQFSQMQGMGGGGPPPMSLQSHPVHSQQQHHGHGMPPMHQQHVTLLASHPSHPRALRPEPAANGGPGSAIMMNTLEQLLRAGGGRGGHGETNAPPAIGATGSAFAPLQQQQHGPLPPMQATSRPQGGGGGAGGSLSDMLATLSQQMGGGGGQRGNNGNGAAGAARSLPPSLQIKQQPMSSPDSSMLPPAIHPGAQKQLHQQTGPAANGQQQRQGQGDMGHLLSLLSQLSQPVAQRSPPENDVVQLSMKFFKTTPQQLPPGLLEELRSWMVKTPTYSELATRPGCVHTTAAALITRAEKEWLCGDVRAAAMRALSSTSMACAGAIPGGVLLQMQAMGGPKAAVVLDGKVRMLLDLGGDRGLIGSDPLPSTLVVCPLAATPDYDGPILVLSPSMDPARDTVYCCSGGANVTTEVVARGAALVTEAGEGVGGWVQLRVPSMAQGGYAMEAQRGVFVTAPTTFLVLDDAAAVEEVRALETDPTLVANAPAFLATLGVLARLAANQELAVELTGNAAARVGQAAQEMAATCLLRGWPALLRMVLPLVDAGESAVEALVGISAGLGQGVSLLAAAVASGSADLVTEVGTWAAARGLPLEAVMAGPGAVDSTSASSASQSSFLTPFHLCAMLREPCPVVEALLALAPGHLDAWKAESSEAKSALSIAVGLHQNGMLRLLTDRGAPAAESFLATLNKEEQRIRDQALQPPCPRHFNDTFPPAAAIKEVVDGYECDCDEGPSASTSCPFAPVLKPEHMTVSAASSAAANTLSSLLTVSTLLSLYILVLGAVLPKDLAIVASLLSILVSVLSVEGQAERGVEIERSWAVGRSTAVGFGSITLSRISGVSSLQAQALEALASNPIADNVMAATGLLAVITHVVCGHVHHAAVLLMSRYVMTLGELPDRASNYNAWIEAIGANACALVLYVCLPLALCRARKAYMDARRAEEQQQLQVESKRHLATLPFVATGMP